MVKTARCTWCGEDPLYVRYHDLEWGVPTRDNHQLFELLMLEGLQAGLSWITILRKRRHLQAALFAFRPELVVRMGPLDLERLLADPGVIRHRGKLEALRSNAERFLDLDAKEGAAQFLWSFVHDKPIVNRRKVAGKIPAMTVESDAMSRALKANGFKFVGSTICYAFMQSAGMVNDHLTSCFRHSECGAPEAKRCTVV
jgi:DNA-3-methyladenine glycosylase I